LALVRKFLTSRDSYREAWDLAGILTEVLRRRDLAGFWAIEVRPITWGLFYIYAVEDPPKLPSGLYLG